LTGGEGGCSTVIAEPGEGRLNEGRQTVTVERCLGPYALVVVSTTVLAWRIYLHQILTEPGVGVKEVWIDAPTLKRS